MPFLNVTRATLSTLSPVHLGCGEDFLPTNYVIDDNGWLHSFNEMVIADVLNQELSAIQKVIETEKGAKMLLGIQKLVYEKRHIFSIASPYHIPVTKGFTEQYHNSIGKVSQQESNDNDVINKLAIMRTFINPHTYQPIMTGSAIKGAIRTAILNQLAQDKGWTSLSDVRNKKKLPQDLLGFDNPTQDPMKLLKISDAEYNHAENLPATEVVLTVSRRRIPKKDKAGSGVTTYLEAISGYRREAFHFDIRHLHNKDVAQHHLIPATTAELAKICNNYYLDKLHKELDELSYAGYLYADYIQGIRELLKGELGQAIRANQVFLLRLGKHTGAYYKTLDNLREIYIPQIKQGSKFVKDPFEVRLAADTNKLQTQNLMPFGWVIVALNDFCLPQTYSFLDKQATANGDFKKCDYLKALQERHAQLPATSAERIKKYLEFVTEQAKYEAEKSQKEKEIIQSTVLDTITQYLRKKTNKALSDDAYLLEELEKNNSVFSNLELKKAAAEYIKTQLQQQGEWVEVSSSDKKERKKFERVQRVKRFL